MKVLKALAALGLVLAPAAQAQFNPYATTSSDIMTITTFNPLRPAGSHVAMLASPGSPMLDIWCVDFQNSIRSPNAVNFTRFDASAADFNARTHFGFANLDNYKKAAWLAMQQQYAATSSDVIDIHYAMWHFLTPGLPTTTRPGEAAWIALAEANYTRVNTQYWWVVADAANTQYYGQEFITTVTPEPASMALVATGLLGLVAVGRTRRRNRKS